MHGSGFLLIAVSQATKLSEAELQDYLNGVMPTDFSRIEYLNIFLILLLNEKPVSDSYYRGLLEELIRVFEIPADIIARYVDVTTDELNEFENSDKRDCIWYNAWDTFRYYFLHYSKIKK